MRSLAPPKFTSWGFSHSFDKEMGVWAIEESRWQWVRKFTLQKNRSCHHEPFLGYLWLLREFLEGGRETCLVFVFVCFNAYTRGWTWEKCTVAVTLTYSWGDPFCPSAICLLLAGHLTGARKKGRRLGPKEQWSFVSSSVNRQVQTCQRR